MGTFSRPLPDHEAAEYEGELVHKLWSMRYAMPSLSHGYTFTSVSLAGAYPDTTVTVTWTRSSEPEERYSARVWSPDGTAIGEPWDIADGILLGIFEGAI